MLLEIPSSAAFSNATRIETHVLEVERRVLIIVTIEGGKKKLYLKLNRTDTRDLIAHLDTAVRRLSGQSRPALVRNAEPSNKSKECAV